MVRSHVLLHVVRYITLNSFAGGTHLTDDHPEGTLGLLTLLFVIAILYLVWPKFRTTIAALVKRLAPRLHVHGSWVVRRFLADRNRRYPSPPRPLP